MNRAHAYQDRLVPGLVYSYLGRAWSLDEPVEVYRNLRRGGYSVRQHGKVVAHAYDITLRDVTFIVSEAGRQRVLKSGHKNVHAYARGYVTLEAPYNVLHFSITYDPRKDGRFVVRNRPDLRFTHADAVRFTQRSVDATGLS